MIRIAYNLVKAMQAEAIRDEAVKVGELGVKATVDLIAECLGEFAETRHRGKHRKAA